MTAIFRREFNAYFTSPIGYVFLAVFYAFSGFFLKVMSLSNATTDITSVFGNMFMILIFLIPVLTMRLMSEDNRQKTDQALLTAPISLTGLVLGKFLAALAIYAMGVAIFLVYAIVLSIFGSMAWAVIWGNILGLLLLGAAFISVGLLVSSLTENQVIAAVGSFVILMALMLIDMVANLIPIDFLSKAVYSLSFYDKFSEFTLGIFNLSNALFFISFVVVLLFLTIRMLERRRWA